MGVPLRTALALTGLGAAAWYSICPLLGEGVGWDCWEYFLYATPVLAASAFVAGVVHPRWSWLWPSCLLATKITLVAAWIVLAGEPIWRTDPLWVIPLVFLAGFWIVLALASASGAAIRLWLSGRR